MLVIAGEHRPIGPGRTVLGRARTCDVTVDDPSVSRQHAELRPEGEGWLVADLGSTNGTFVNGRRIQTAPLHEVG
jgi:pSer/pThr/pTyr-binding forkhead associated (FHA) protein